MMRRAIWYLISKLSQSPLLPVICKLFMLWKMFDLNLNGVGNQVRYIRRRVLQLRTSIL